MPHISVSVRLNRPDFPEWGDLPKLFLTILSFLSDGARIASSTGIDILLMDDFKLVINDTTHIVRPPRRGSDQQREKDLVKSLDHD